MRRTALVIAFVVGMSAPSFAQQAEIEAANAKWIEFFNRVILAALRRFTLLMRPHFHLALRW